MKRRSSPEPTITSSSIDVASGVEAKKGTEKKLAKVPFAQVRDAIALKATEVLDENVRRKALFYELYDKVNIANLLFVKSAKSFKSPHVPARLVESYADERVRMISRYICYLQRLGASTPDYAKALAIWRGGLTDTSVQGMMIYAERISTIGDISEEMVNLVVEDAQLPISVSGVQWESADFGNQSKDQIKSKDLRSQYDQERRDSYDRALGRVRVARLYDLIKDFAPYFDDGTIDGKGLLDRSIDELFEMKEKYSHVVNRMSVDSFSKVAAVLLKMCGSCNVNLLRDDMVFLFAEFIAKGAKKSEIKRVLALMFKVKVV